jgi:hypothetical protein
LRRGVEVKGAKVFEGRVVRSSRGEKKRPERIVWRDFDIIQGIYLKQMQDKCNLGIFFWEF